MDAGQCQGLGNDFGITFQFGHDIVKTYVMSRDKIWTSDLLKVDQHTTQRPNHDCACSCKIVIV